ncbi:AAA family ATPase [Variovorax saccharolyticus]|uniref:AAA family ATPase n=1 Tax=Variovorax saccharolyticus TaxID=3053516 RepID=UPI0025788F38|nr:adenylate/guanylate cyclase domain-containing protein [Variovorax sp. J22R187]MDM0021459.1 adenylate/guanylate cyclase domain-containing protein [Variovorax sp. J22R187]
MDDVAQWLQGLSLGEYAQAFAEQGVEFDLLGELGDDDLKALGVAALGHRKRLLRAIATLSSGAGPSPQAASVEAMAAASTSPRDAERRHLTVMFCDMVGSTALSARLDPEDLQQLIRGYHEEVAMAVAPCEGHVAQLLGDGALVYFGYPQAHEDDATRAVRSALSLVKALDARRARGDIELQTRIGIATGRVVVGAIGKGTAAAERSASGETPNLAARLQAQARPGEIVLADETRKLVGDSFVLESLGLLDLKGFAEPVKAWRVAGEHRVATRFEAQHMHGLVEFIGRDSELALLLERWALARDGEGQVVLLSGEAGIGKSRICQVLRERLAGESVATVLLQCSPYFSSSALYPVVQHLERTAGMAPADPPEDRARKLELMAGALPASSLGCLLRLVGLPDGGRSSPGGASPQEEKAHTLEGLIDLLLRLSRQQPVLFLVEDAHWIDPTTEELIGQVAERIRDARVLLVVTCRPGYIPSWSGASQATRHSLNRLSRKQSAALVGGVTAGKALPAEVLDQIIGKTDGIPLFIEELTKTVVQSGLLEDTPSGYRLSGPLPRLAISATLQDSLMARLDRLAAAKEVAQVGAVIGREFGHRLVVELLGAMPPPRLAAALAELVRSELVFRRGTPPDATYSFKHALVRDTAYDCMLRSQRVLWHRQIAAALEKPDRAAPAAQAELLAYHHQEGGNAAAALRHWQAAGDQAMARSAVREAVTHYQAAVALLGSVQAVEPCAQVELGLRIQLGNAVFQTEGFTSSCAKENYTRARDLAASLDRPDEQLHACGGIATGLIAAGQCGEAIALLERYGPAELMRVKPMGRVIRLVLMGVPRMYLGALEQASSDLTEARRELERVRPQEWQALAGADPLVAILMHLASSLVFRGLLSSAHACVHEGLAMAEQRQHSNSRVWALRMTGVMSGLKGEWKDAITHFTQAIELAERHGLKAFGVAAKSGLGLALVATGRFDEGTRLLREGYSGWTTFGGRFASIVSTARAAEVLLDAGRREEATEFLLAGEKALQETVEWFQAAPFLSLRGRLAELDGDLAGAETAYRRASKVAGQQGAFLYALRAATALARLCRAQGRADEAEAVLRPIYGRFTEGFDYPDLVRASALLPGI